MSNTNTNCLQQHLMSFKQQHHTFHFVSFQFQHNSRCSSPTPKCQRRWLRLRNDRLTSHLGTSSRRYHAPVALVADIDCWNGHRRGCCNEGALAQADGVGNSYGNPSCHFAHSSQRSDRTCRLCQIGHIDILEHTQRPSLDQVPSDPGGTFTICPPS